MIPSTPRDRYKFSQNVIENQLNKIRDYFLANREEKCNKASWSSIGDAQHVIALLNEIQDFLKIN
jgi:hypothetical protein